MGSERVKADIQRQVPRYLGAAKTRYEEARLDEVAALVTTSPAITPLVDHMALRTVVSSGEKMALRTAENAALRADDYREAQSIDYWTNDVGGSCQISKQTKIYAQRGQMSQADYETLQRSPDGFGGVFSTFYVVKGAYDIAGADIMTYVTDWDGRSPAQKTAFLEDPAIPVDVKSTVCLHANGVVNHYALSVTDMKVAGEAMKAYSAGGELNELQKGEFLNQQSTWDVGSDYIELVTRNLVAGQVHLDKFKVENTEPLFRSNVLALLRTYLTLTGELDEESGAAITADQEKLLKFFPDAQEALGFFFTSGMFQNAAGPGDVDAFS